MPSKVTKKLKIEGLKELEEALKELPKATAKNTIRRAIIAAAQPIIDTATMLIRVRRIQPPVVISKIKFTAGNAGKRAFAEAMAEGATRAEAGEAAHAANIAAKESGGDDVKITSGVASIGPTKRAFYGFEFGTIHLAPKPFMRPAWDQHKEKAAEAIGTELKEQIDKAVKRLAAKQKKLISSI